MKTKQLLAPAMKEQLAELGDRLRQLRIARRVTQGEAAVRTGISRTTLHQIESGAPGVAVGQIIRYIDALAPGKTLVNLLTEADPAVLAMHANSQRIRARPLSASELMEINF